MRITRLQFTSNGTSLPMIKMSSDTPLGSAVIMHGFGGCKEEQLGLSFRVAQFGLDTYAVDLRGHGQNVCPLSFDILQDLNTLLQSLKAAGRTIAIGHSLGGRISLLSDADIRIGISPALAQTFSGQTVAIINSMRKHRVIESEPDSNFRILNRLPVVDDYLGADDMILYGERDVPEIVRDCQALAQKGKNVIQIRNAMHGDTFLLESSFAHLENWLLQPGRLP